MLAIRKELGLFANLRPIRTQRQLIGASPLRPELIEGVDILFVRELTGGIYFGPSGVSDDGTVGVLDDGVLGGRGPPHRAHRSRGGADSAEAS